jgi:hypothetical protein
VPIITSGCDRRAVVIFATCADWTCTGPLPRRRCAHQLFAGHSAHGVLDQHRVRNLVGNLVRVTFSHRFGSKQICTLFLAQPQTPSCRKLERLAIVVKLLQVVSSPHSMPLESSVRKPARDVVQFPKVSGLFIVQVTSPPGALVWFTRLPHQDNSCSFKTYRANSIRLEIPSLL